MLIEAFTQTTLGNVYILTGDDDLHVGTGVTITCTYNDPVTHTGADAVISWIGTHTITVDGTIVGEDEAINLVGCVTAQTVVINAGGHLISGGDGVVEDADGVILDGVGSTMTNAGLIEAYGSAISVMVPDAGTTTISNSGTMIGRVSGVWHKFGNGILNFTNTGTVESTEGESFRGGISTDNVTNRGTMIGDVDLRGGNDRYDGRLGSVDGDILGGDGDDVFVPGTSAEAIFGGAGSDTLDFSAATVSITVNLTLPVQNKGAPVIGDTYSSIENLRGGAVGDRLVGNAQDNTLLGNGKGDTLGGADGDDVLIGGHSKDRLYGGAGADDFVFLAKNQLTDLIYDFASGEDQIHMEGYGFGFGTYTGALAANAFVSGTTNLAQDADDRFIFRTTDQTLWIDKDGTGIAKAICKPGRRSRRRISTFSDAGPFTGPPPSQNHGLGLGCLRY
jgi:Ca2+-binding RTX toxin-like protein